MIKKWKDYIAEFKSIVVEEYVNGDHSYTLSKKYGIADVTVTNWVRAANQVVRSSAYYTKINDKFSSLNLSKQRKAQLRHAEAGRCIICGKPKPPMNSLYCEKHRLSINKYRKARYQRRKI